MTILFLCCLVFKEHCIPRYPRPSQHSGGGGLGPATTGGSQLSVSTLPDPDSETSARSHALALAATALLLLLSWLVAALAARPPAAATTDTDTWWWEAGFAGAFAATSSVLGLTVLVYYCLVR